MNHIRLIACLAAIALLVGCAHHSIQASAVVAAENPLHHIHEFDAVTIATPIEKILSSFGQPDQDVGSGIHIWAYNLDDGSMVQIGSADGSTILYLDHVFPGGKRTRILPGEGQ
jgi:hypothetical protein